MFKTIGIFVFVLASFTVVSNSTSNKVVRNGSGQIVGRIYNNGEVRDEGGTLLGKVKNGSTYDSKGRRVLDKELPGYLLKCK